MSFAAFIGGAMRPTVDRYKAEQETKRRLEEHASAAKLDKALNEWEFYTPDERAAVAPELDKILKQKKGYSAELLGKSEQGYKFLKGALEQQKPIQSLESSAQRVAAQPINLGGTMTGPESLDAVNPGEFERSATPIQLPSKPVSLPPLPIEGADIPRVDRNVLQLPASQRVAAAKSYQTRQAEMLARQGKVGEIGTSPLDPEDKETAIESLYLPPGVLSARERNRRLAAGGAGNRDIGLGVTEFVSPDGTQRIYAQATRGGGFMDSRTGKLLAPGALEGWTKVFNQSLYVTPNQAGSVDVLNRQRLGQQMNQTGTLTGTVPDIRPAETLIPETTPTGKIIAMRGSRTGRVQGADGGPAPEGPRYKGALSDATQSTLAQLDNFQASIDFLTKPQEGQTQSLLDKHKDKVGFFRGNVEKGLAEVGLNIPGTQVGGDPEVDSIITELKSMQATYTYLVSGKQINEAEQKRLAAVLPDIGQPANRMKNNMARFQRTIAIMRKVRELGQEEGASEADLAAADAGGPSSTLSPTAQQRRGAAPLPASEPKIGDHKEFPNGNIGVWDGKGWKKLNRPSSQ